MADLVEFNLPPGDVAVLQFDRVVDRREADDIKARWRMSTGRDCVLLTRGVRLKAVIRHEGTPIFDEMARSPRWRGSAFISRLARGR